MKAKTVISVAFFLLCSCGSLEEKKQTDPTAGPFENPEKGSIGMIVWQE